MYRFEKLLVVLSLGENDTSLINYAKNIAQLARSESVHFLYAREPVEIPVSIKKQYPWMTQPITVAAKDKVETLVNERFGSLPNCKTTVSIEERHPTFAAYTAAGKPIYLSEIGCANDPRKAEWIRDFLDRASNDERLTGFVYFQHFNPRKGEPDWRLESDIGSLNAFQNWSSNN